MRRCTREPNRCGYDGYYEVHKQVCLYSRSSRLLWGSGNTRRNRTEIGRERGAGFPKWDVANVGVLEKRWVMLGKHSGSPMASTGEHAEYAMPLWWMGGNMGSDRAGSGDSPARISTAGRLGTGFAVNPHRRVDCGGPGAVRCERGPCGVGRWRRRRGR